MKLHTDIETYSPVDIRKSGAYRYIESPDFEILMVAYAFDNGPIKIAEGVLPLEFTEALRDPKVEKHAHNANFERLAFKRVGLDVPISQWRCSMVKSAYCGLPLGLDTVSEALNLGEKGKLKTGTSLINYFCKPCKPTKTNGGRTRNLPEHNPAKWEEFKRYCINDVEAEREVDRILAPYELPISVLLDYQLDQEINDRGIKIDINLAENAKNIDERRQAELTIEAKQLTGLDNPNSAAQLKDWLLIQTGEKIETLAKDNIQPLIDKFSGGVVQKVLELRRRMAKTSTAKYIAMLSCVCDDDRARGLFQFYGANRTGRWAGRLVQLQNLPKNHIPDLDVCRGIIAHGEYTIAKMMFYDIANTLSQLVRTAFVAKRHHTFAVADFSAIEARVLSWVAGEQWRIDVFSTHGKIYEASASAMFGAPLEEIGKDSALRQKGKIAELALGYGGSIGALTQMGGEDMGLSSSDMNEIVSRWRAANPAIVRFWARVDKAAKRALKTKRPVHVENVTFLYDGTFLTIELPSGRKLYYYKPSFTVNRFGGESIKYRGMDQTTKQWTWIETYGGKLTENIIQAISRDLLAYSMQELDAAGFDIVMHVHDEAAAEVLEYEADAKLKEMCDIMGSGPAWSEGLPLNADGYITKYYKKD